MSDDYDARVRQRAHRIWLEEGCPDGRAAVHWEMARELVAIEDNLATTLIPVPSQGGDAVAGEPVEDATAAANTGGFPTMVDQGEQSYPPSRSNVPPNESAKPRVSRRGTKKK
jgi:Protein of unknown function (DUF2934)